jgi:hypothetical protein
MSSFYSTIAATGQFSRSFTTEISIETVATRFSHRMAARAYKWSIRLKGEFQIGDIRINSLTIKGNNIGIQDSVQVILQQNGYRLFIVFISSFPAYVLS